MDNTNVVTETPKLTSVSPTDSSQSSESSWNMGSLFRYGLIILIIAFLGFNLFAYLGKATDKTTGILGPFLQKITSLFTSTFKQTAEMAGKGTKLGADVAAGVVKSGVDVTEGTIKSGIDVLEGTLTGKKQRNKIDNSVTTALDDAKEKKKPEQIPIPDEAGSRTQSSKSSGKAGFCYIGEDRGFRSCVKVNEGDTCLSGDIFPSKDICINPNLRL